MNIVYLSDLTSLKFMLQIFILFGLSTFTIVTKKIKSDKGDRQEPYFVESKIAICYNFLFIVFICVTNYLTINTLYTTRYRKTLSLFHIIDFFEIFFGTFVACLILIFYCRDRKTSITLTAKIYKMKLITDQLNPDQKGKSTLLYLALIIIFHLVMSVILLGSGFIYYHNLLLLFSGASRNFVVTWLLLQYALVVRVLGDMFENINVALSSLIKLPQIEVHYKNNLNISVLLSTRKLQLLSSVRDTHYALLKICLEVSKFYELTILGYIAYIFVCLVVFTYFLVDLVIERKITFSIIEYVHLFFWLLCFTSSFIPLSRFITNITNEVC